MNLSETKKLALVWSGLLFLSLLSWLLVSNNSILMSNSVGDLKGDSLAAIILLVLAFLKVRLIVLHFMEVKTAPPLLRAIFEVWVIGVCGILVYLY